MAAQKKATKKQTTRRKKKAGAEPGSRGPTPAEVAADSPPAEVQALADAVAADGGRALATFRDPLGGHWQLLVGLPIDKIEPTPFQRDVSETHHKRLAECIDKLDRFLDPVIVVRHDSGVYWTPNGNHRLHAMRSLGARSITALLVPDAEMAYRILALNTERAHNLREKALEVIRMAHDLAAIQPEPEESFALVFEEPSFLTLGACYEQKGRFAGSAYQPVLKRVEAFLDMPLPASIELRERRARKLLDLDAAVNDAVQGLKDKGFDSPYLKNFVVARVNPLRFAKKESPDWDATIDKMLASARGFDPGKIKVDQVARTGGAAAE